MTLQRYLYFYVPNYSMVLPNPAEVIITFWDKQRQNSKLFRKYMNLSFSIIFYTSINFLISVLLR